MWRMVSKVILWFSFVCGILGPLILSVICFSSDEDAGIIFGIIVLFGGIILSLVSCSFLGMVIELCDNVAAIKNSLKQNALYYNSFGQNTLNNNSLRQNTLNNNSFGQNTPNNNSFTY